MLMLRIIILTVMRLSILRLIIPLMSFEPEHIGDKMEIMIGYKLTNGVWEFSI